MNEQDIPSGDPFAFAKPGYMHLLSTPDEIHGLNPGEGMKEPEGRGGDEGQAAAGWGIYNESAGPQPESHFYHVQAGVEEEIILISYGCTRLRISEFPVVGK